jgi:hypothetical protein
VVRRDGRFAEQLRVAAQQPDRSPEVEPDAVGQLAGGLAGEGEAEHLVGRTCGSTMSHMTRSAMSSVLPEPAPATTSSGSVRRRGDDRLLLLAGSVAQAEPRRSSSGVNRGPT